jgi:hypothetical protein
LTSFWEKRRASVAAEEEAEAKAVKRAAALRAEAEFDALPDEDILAKFDLPEPEALDTPEAVKHFMRHALPQRLKTRALRRLWRLNPVFANLDGLVDYDQDFTDAATVVENLQTSYRVGKGMLAHIEHLAKAEADAAEAASREMTEDDVSEVSEPEAAPETETPAQVYAYQDSEEAAPAPGPSRRRMTFQFEKTT